MAARQGNKVPGYGLSWFLYGIKSHHYLSINLITLDRFNLYLDLFFINRLLRGNLGCNSVLESRKYFQDQPYMHFDDIKKMTLV